MTLYLKYDLSQTYKSVIEFVLKNANIEYNLVNLNEVQLTTPLELSEKVELQDQLSTFHIEIVDDPKLSLVQRMKFLIDLYLKDKEAQLRNVSDFLAEELDYSYAYLSSLFSEATFTSIESFIILRKVEMAKELLLKTSMSLTEVAFELNYSSVAHLSTQFKKTTGLTPSAFQRIIQKRKSMFPN
ncbi:AraC family transcriptional regulator [Flavobacterium sp. ASW18X]|uniref:helix-turn-helix domain-containing protein n=1 Tax=Flavobacterium sp. ASW18X TaxID=2572595 RepID=UPI0010AED5E2|nr:AraC family transcriptional regulator [Flavobacterium sp. ASW18X]TKD66033.1 helix-turn-helix transcriptional regulator [Flavobacterium sp. ASW18X]